MWSFLFTVCKTLGGLEGGVLSLWLLFIPFLSVLEGPGEDEEEEEGGVNRTSPVPAHDVEPTMDGFLWCKHSWEDSAEDDEAWVGVR